MNLKIEITKFLIKELGLISPNNKSFNIWKHKIWKNPRENKHGSLGLTSVGFELMLKANIQQYSIKFDQSNQIDLTFNNNFVLWLDRNFNFPYFLNLKSISFFSKKPAVELALFDGNLIKYYYAHQKFQQKQNLIDKNTI